MTARRVTPEPRPSQAQQYYAAMRVYFASDDLDTLKRAIAADPAVRKESVWTYRISARERTHPKED